MRRKMTCIYCPIGCTLEVEVEHGIVRVVGNRCPRGCEYARQELLDPKRIFFTVVRVEGEEYRVAAVRSVEPLPKNEIKKMIKRLSKLHLSENTKVSDIIANINGVNIIVTRK